MPTHSKHAHARPRRYLGTAAVGSCCLALAIDGALGWLPSPLLAPHKRPSLHCSHVHRQTAAAEAAAAAAASLAAVSATETHPAANVCFDGPCDFAESASHSSDTAHDSTPATFETPKKKKKSPRPTVWSEFSALAADTGAINLGQGFPNWEPPQFVTDAGIAAITSGHNQYTRTAGHPRLVELLAGRYTKHFGREVDPYAEVAITIGASQALYVTMQVLLSPGDEVILLEPFFDLYVGQIEMAGGTPVYVPLATEGRRWRLDAAALRAAITPRTRAIILNSPHNPTGKVFTRDEMLAVADAIRAHPRAMVISDEVYKYMVYGDDNGDSGGGAGGGGGALSPSRHVHFATLPGMWNRTVTISSAGKTFSVTGWQVGWALGPRWFIRDVHAALPYMQFCAATPMQEAMATALERADQPYRGHASYYDWLRTQYAQRCAALAAALDAAGIPTMRGEGGFFLIGDVSRVRVSEAYLRAGTPAMPRMTRDWAFCRWLALEHGVIAIPTAPFFRREAEGGEGAGENPLCGRFVRFCFCKTDETLAAAAAALAEMSRKTAAEEAQ